jgi:hypothetical protein
VRRRNEREVSEVAQTVALAFQLCFAIPNLPQSVKTLLFLLPFIRFSMARLRDINNSKHDDDWDHSVLILISMELDSGVYNA